MHIHFTEKNEFKTVLFLVTCRFCKRMCRTSSYLFGRNVNASLYWGYDTPKGSSQLPPAPYYYYYFWTDLRLGEPHIDSKTARGIILAIDFENSPNKQLNFAVESKPPGSAHTYFLTNFSINFESSYLTHQTQQYQDAYSVPFKGVNRNSNKHTILLQEHSILIASMSAIFFLFFIFI